MSLIIRPGGRFATATDLGVIRTNVLLNVEQIDLLVHAMKKHKLVPKQVTQAVIDTQGGIRLTAYRLNTKGDFAFTEDGDLIEEEFS